MPAESTLRRMAASTNNLLNSSDSVLLNPTETYSCEKVGPKSNKRRFDKQPR